MLHLSQLFITTPRFEKQKVIVDLVDSNNRSAGFFMEITRGGDLRLVRFTSALTADLKLRSTSNSVFRKHKAIEKAVRDELWSRVRELDGGADGPDGLPARRLARRLLDFLLSAIEELDTPLSVATGDDLATFHRLLEAALMLHPFRNFESDEELWAQNLTLDVGGAQQNAPAFYAKPSPPCIDPASDLHVLVRAICRAYRPVGTLRQASRTGILSARERTVRASRPNKPTAHQRLAATKLIAEFWTSHPEIGTPARLTTPRLAEMTAEERFILAVPETPASEFEIIEVSGDRTLMADYACGTRRAHHQAHVRGYIQKIKVAENNPLGGLYCRGPAWLPTVERLLGGADPALLAKRH